MVGTPIGAAATARAQDRHRATVISVEAIEKASCQREEVSPMDEIEAKLQRLERQVRRLERRVVELEKKPKRLASATSAPM
jgi:predicted RNase H-like nuclease (RuvC/YqgF family)